jgi:NADPH:quinone reductase-like Zn-dependent oxidoreductase
MKAIVTTRRGNPVAPNVSFVTDARDPVAGAGEAVVRTEASALNHLDLWVARGLSIPSSVAAMDAASSMRWARAWIPRGSASACC